MKKQTEATLNWVNSTIEFARAAEANATKEQQLEKWNAMDSAWCSMTTAYGRENGRVEFGSVQSFVRMKSYDLAWEKISLNHSPIVEHTGLDREDFDRTIPYYRMRGECRLLGIDVDFIEQVQ